MNGLSIIGHGRAALRDENGLVKELREFDNVFTDVGDAHVADQMESSPDEAPMSDMAVGTSTTTLTAGDTQLGSRLCRRLGGRRRNRGFGGGWYFQQPHCRFRHDALRSNFLGY